MSSPVQVSAPPGPRHPVLHTREEKPKSARVERSHFFAFANNYLNYDKTKWDITFDKLLPFFSQNLEWGITMCGEMICADA